MHINKLWCRIACAPEDKGGGGNYQDLFNQQQGLNQRLQSQLDAASAEAEAARKAREEAEAQFQRDRDAMAAKVAEFEKRDQERAAALYESLDETKRAQADLVKGELKTDKYLEFLGALTSTTAGDPAVPPNTNPPIRPRGAGDRPQNSTKMDPDTADTLDFLGYEVKFHDKSVITRDPHEGYRMELPLKTHRAMLKTRIVPGKKLRD